MTTALEMMQNKLRNVPQYADEVKEKDRRKQLQLFQRVVGCRVADGVQITETRSGETVFVMFFAPVNERVKGSAKPVEGVRHIALVWRVEPKRDCVRLEEVLLRDGVYYLVDGTNFAAALRDGNFNY